MWQIFKLIIVLVVVSIVVVLCFLCIWMRRLMKNNFFRRFLSNPPGKPISEEEVDKILDRSLLSHEKFLEEKFDVIIIGSGLSALTSAGLLSRSGKKCLILESRDKLGGSLRGYTEEGFHFCPGLSYLINCEDAPWRVTMDIVSEKSLKYDKIDNRLRDLCFFGKNEPVEIIGAGDFKKMRQFLLNRFPNEKKGLEKFCDLVEKCKESYNEYFACQVVPFPINLILRHILGFEKLFTTIGRKPAIDVIKNDCGITDKNLIACLLHYRTNVSTSSIRLLPFGILVVILHMTGDRYYLEGGGDSFAKTIIPRLKNGSKALHSARVVRILTEKGGRKITGVELETGQMVYAEHVISSAGIGQTLDLLPKKISTCPKCDALNQVLKQCEYTGHHFIVEIGLECSIEDSGLTHRLYYYCSNDDFEEFDEQLSAIEAPEFDGFEEHHFFELFITDDHPEKKCTILLFGYCNPKWFSRFNDTETGKRGNEYEEIKRTLCDKYLQLMYERHPQLEDLVQVISCGSNLTCKDYFGKVSGGGYGLLTTYEKIVMTSGKKEVFHPMEGLYLVGQDVVCSGCFPVVLSTFSVVGDIIGRNLFMDLQNVEKEFHQIMMKKKEEGEKEKEK